MKDDAATRAGWGRATWIRALPYDPNEREEALTERERDRRPPFADAWHTEQQAEYGA